MPNSIDLLSADVDDHQKGVHLISSFSSSLYINMLIYFRNRNCDFHLHRFH